MNIHHLINIALATIGLGLLLAFVGPTLLDGPDDRSAEHAQALAMRDAIKGEQVKARFQKAALALCGSENAVPKLQEDGSVQCLTKKGRKSAKVDSATVAKVAM